MPKIKKEALDNVKLRSRVERAIMEVYNSFIRTKGREDYYLESTLNSFIALVQYPISFVILEKREDGGRVPAFHFCTDKEHQGFFEKYLEECIFTDRSVFSLFPEVLRYQKYDIAIFLMHTKPLGYKNKFSIIKKNPAGKSINSIGSYIAAAAQEFFGEPWLGFTTYFREQARAAFISSIERSKNNHRWLSGGVIGTFPANPDEIWGKQQDILLPNRDWISWRKKMERLFRRAFFDGSYGYEVTSRMLHPKDHNVDYPDTSYQPTNMIVGYRSFTRETGDLRHENENGGYPYDITFLVPEDKRHAGSYTRYFQHLKDQYYGFSDLIKGKGERKSYHKRKEQRCLYSKLFTLKKNHYELNKAELKKYVFLSEILDREFWTILEKDDGIETFLDCLRAPVGRGARSLVDPSLNTGLIHVNKIFELGGLDRVPVSEYQKIKSLGGFPEDVRADMLRIVILYYLFSGMASWSGPTGQYDPRNVAAIIVPLKMRGATWAVTVHATYMDDAQEYFLNDNVWLSSFLLMTSSRRKNHEQFDTRLWDNTKSRVTKLLMNSIGASPISQLKKAITETVNEKLAGEQRLVPYALPVFSLSVGNGFPNDSGNEIDIPFLPDRYIRVSWEIAENDFFVARQPWTKKGTRSFRNAVHLGVRRGVEEMTSMAVRPKTEN